MGLTKNIGVVGAGVIGVGVAQSLSEAGFKVILLDLSKDILEFAKDEIYKNCRFKGFLNQNLNSEDPESVISRIEFTTDYSILSSCDFVVENVTEKPEIKKEVYGKLDSVCNEECIYLVNTSCISITKIASFCKRPDKVMGTHFMNPVPLKPIVEGIRGYHTSEETIEKTKMLLKDMGKECIVVNDFPGFVVNRISHLLINEAAFIVQDQVASPEEVDELFKKCMGHKMGPLATADLIGLDTVVNSIDVLYESYNDTKFRCCPLLRKMVYAGLLGLKSGKGFYEYSGF